MRLSFLYPAILVLLTLTPDSTIAAKSKTPKDAILLSKVKSLTLRHGKRTSHRRVPAVPQLFCVGGNAKGLHNVEIMRCTNQGSDYEEQDSQWSCTADLPAEFRLGSTDVICEGYDSSNDPYVLKGSCGVEYRLILTDIGEEKYGKKSDFGEGDSTALAKALFWILFLCVAGWIVYSVWTGLQGAPGARRAPRQGGGWGNGWGGGGGGGGGDPWDPPPPYPGKRYSQRGQNEGWRPGFWTGTAAGAAAGYAAGSRGQRQQTTPNNSWFGGNTGTAGSSRPSFGSSNSSSSSRHESTGFGSTSRR